MAKFQPKPAGPRWLTATFVCERCGQTNHGSSNTIAALCANCQVAEMITASQQKEYHPFREAAEYGRQAIVEMLRARWCDR